ncbi:hypothetical protein Peur_019814 [Populus x canadensis]
MTSTSQQTQQHEVPVPPLSAPKATGAEFHEPPLPSTVTEGSQLHPPPLSDEETKKWGTHIMGPPPAPNVHPDIRQAALWVAVEQDRLFQKLLGVRYVNLTARALAEGGFESLFILIFETDPSEKLEKTSACYLSTSTGLLLDPSIYQFARVAFCSDRPLCYTAPSGQEAWSYYKVRIFEGTNSYYYIYSYFHNGSPLNCKEMQR